MFEGHVIFLFIHNLYFFRSTHSYKYLNSIESLSWLIAFFGMFHENLVAGFRILSRLGPWTSPFFISRQRYIWNNNKLSFRSFCDNWLCCRLWCRFGGRLLCGWNFGCNWSWSRCRLFCCRSSLFKIFCLKL